MRIAIHSILAQDVPQNSYELIIVDNNSTDNTREVFTESSVEHPNIRYFHEEKQGLSHARNRGLKEARGEYIVYIDDECILPPGYLALVFGIIDKIKPDIFGGPIKAYYDFERPHWIKDEYFSEFLDKDSGILSPEEYVYGGNMGIKTETLNKLGGFNVNLGMKGNELAFAEEVEFQRRAVETIPNLNNYFDSDLWLYHHVRKEKVNLRWLIGFHFYMGMKGLEGLNAVHKFQTLSSFWQMIGLFKALATIFYRLVRICIRLIVMVLFRGEKYPCWQQYLFERIYEIEVKRIGVNYAVIKCTISSI